MAGRGGPRHTRAYDDICFMCYNTMFYVDRLHKLVGACSDFVGNANAIVLNMGARLSKKHDANKYFYSTKLWQVTTLNH